LLSSVRPFGHRALNNSALWAAYHLELRCLPLTLWAKSNVEAQGPDPKVTDRELRHPIWKSQIEIEHLVRGVRLEASIACKSEKIDPTDQLCGMAAPRYLEEVGEITPERNFEIEAGLSANR
jgi:hypothetical protein